MSRTKYLSTIALTFSLLLSGCFEVKRGGSSLPGGPNGGGSDFDPFVLSGPVGTPTVLSNGVAQENRAFSYVPDISGDAALKGATFTVKNRPSWATFNPATGALTGNPVEGVASTGVEVLATAGAASKNFGPFDFTAASDTFKNSQWFISNTGQTAFAKNPGVSGQDMKVKAAIERGYTGKGVRVAVSDDGLEIAHEDISMNMLTNESKNYTAVGQANDPTPANAGDAHGTAVTGIIAAKGWNNKGGRGIAPDAKVAAFNFIVSQSDAAYLDQISGNFDIYNQSWGSGAAPNNTGYSPIHPDPAIRRAYIETLTKGVNENRGGKGSLYVRSAGNSYNHVVVSTNPVIIRTLPATFDELNAFPTTLVVGAMNAKGIRSSYSSIGSNLWIAGLGGEFGDTDPAMVTMDLSGCNRGFSVSPATAAANTFETGLQGNVDCKYTSIMNGTSSAAPSIAGVIALMLQARPGLTWRDVKHILAKTATQVDLNYVPPTSTSALNPTGYISEPGWITNAAGFKFHNWYGFGRADALAAVDMATTYGSLLGNFRALLNSDGSFRYGSGIVNLPIADNSLVAPAVSTINIPESISIEAVQISLNVTHTNPGDLAVELVAPSGTKSILMPMNNGVNVANFNNVILLSNAFYGEAGGGNWTLRLIDGRAAAPNTTGGTLNSWRINIYGH